MNTLIVLMLAYSVISVGSVVLSMRATISHGFSLMSLLYLILVVGLALFFFNQLSSLPQPLSPAFLAEVRESKARLASLAERDPYPHLTPVTMSGAALLAMSDRNATLRENLQVQASAGSSRPFRGNRRQVVGGETRYEASSAALPVPRLAQSEPRGLMPTAGY